MCEQYSSLGQSLYICWGAVALSPEGTGSEIIIPKFNVVTEGSLDIARFHVCSGKGTQLISFKNVTYCLYICNFSVP